MSRLATLVHRALELDLKAHLAREVARLARTLAEASYVSL
ncbi:hypothetical protein A2U01_0070957 [Trifolium medium]|uniref:Uncharacterized protein n=1 Tax=Trifolium medium TaxID=97028 RepID=A0A392SLG3_9FABA|nr:hypothetical protein [Trifolium medium]